MKVNLFQSVRSLKALNVHNMYQLMVLVGVICVLTPVISWKRSASRTNVKNPIMVLHIVTPTSNYIATYVLIYIYYIILLLVYIA